MIRSGDINFEVKNTFEPPPVNAGGGGYRLLKSYFLLYAIKLSKKNVKNMLGPQTIPYPAVVFAKC